MTRLHAHLKKQNKYRGDLNGLERDRNIMASVYKAYIKY